MLLSTLNFWMSKQKHPHVNKAYTKSALSSSRLRTLGQSQHLVYLLVSIGMMRVVKAESTGPTTAYAAQTKLERDSWILIAVRTIAVVATREAIDVGALPPHVIIYGAGAVSLDESDRTLLS